MSITPKNYAYKEALILLLKQYSIDKSIKGPLLAAKLGIRYVTMRELAAYLTSEGLPIGSDTKHGYYWARTPEEMDPKIHQLESRIVGNARHLKGAKKAKRLLERTAATPRIQMDLEGLFTPTTTTQSTNFTSAV